MPAYLDIAALDFKDWKKGDIVGLAIEGKQCSVDPTGRLVCVVITDANREEVQQYTEEWNMYFRHVYVSENDLGWRYRIEVDPVYISASGLGKDEVKDAMVYLIENDEYWEGSSVFKIRTDYMTVDIPKNGPYQTASGLSDLDYLKLLKSNFSDVFRTTLNISRYHFSEADVDLAIANGGRVEITKLQALNRALDKLEE